MGLDYYQAFSSIHCSFSELNTEEEALTAVETIAHHYQALSGRIPAPVARGRLRLTICPGRAVAGFPPPTLRGGRAEQPEAERLRRWSAVSWPRLPDRSEAER